MTAAKRYRDGTHRALPPEETLAAILPSLDRIGVTRVADITGLDRIGVPVFTAYRPNSRSLAVTQGKGRSASAAKASAVMEALEYHCAETARLSLRHATLAELRQEGRRVIDVDALPRLEGRAVPQHSRVLWASGEDLAGGGTVLVPYELVHLDFTLPFAPGLGAFVMSSNGLASGNTMLEALIHAICELIERHAIAVWTGGGSAERRIDPQSVDEPGAAELLARFAAADLQTAIWDISGPMGVPVFYTTVLDREDGGGYPASGSGCHPHPGVALSRALTEAAQTRLTLISGARDDRSQKGNASLTDIGLRRALEADLSQAAGHDFGKTAGFDGNSFEDDLAWLLARLSDAGLGSPVAVDLSQKELPAHVVRVFLPGLEGADDAPGYGGTLS